MHLTHILKRSARLFPDAPALTCQGQTISWKQFRDRCARLGGALRTLGIGEGDRVAMLMFNSSRMAELFYGPAWIGAAYMPLNYRWTLREMKECLDDCTPRILVVDGEHADMGRRLMDSCPYLEHLIFADDGVSPEGLLDYDQLLEEAVPAEDVDRGGDDLAALFYTGGTTGRAKGVMLSHQNLYVNAMSANTYYELSPTTRFLMAPPIFHVACGSRVYSASMAGAHMVMLRNFTPADALETIERERITDGLFVPTMLNMMINHPRFGEYDLSTLSHIAYGASPMPKALLQRTMILLPGVSFYQGYGMTEASPILTVMPSKYHQVEGPYADKLSSVGVPAHHVDLRIVDARDRDVAPGEIGELVARGPNIMLGYWRQPELTRETLRGGWYHTGDAGYMDPDGFVFLVDRVKDMIVSGGENIYSSDVENALYAHPEVAECAVIGIPHSIWGEAVHAIIYPKNGAAPAEEELIDFCKSRIAGYKCPRSIELSPTPLPKSGTNKILKSELRKSFWKDHESAVI